MLKRIPLQRMAIMNVKKQKEIDNYIVHGSGAKLVSNWEQNMLYTKS